MSAWFEGLKWAEEMFPHFGFRILPSTQRQSAEFLAGVADYLEHHGYLREAGILKPSKPVVWTAGYARTRPRGKVVAIRTRRARA